MKRRKLGAYESALAVTNEYSPLNAVSVLQLSSLPELETLRNAFKILQSRHPLLRSQIGKEHGNYYFDIQESQDLWIEVQARDGEESWMTAVETELNHQIDFSGQPLIRCIMLRQNTGGTKGEILLNFQHSIMDAASGANLLHEMMHLCRTIETGEQGTKQTPLPLHAASDEMYPPMYRGLPGDLHKAGFILRQMAGEAAYRWQTRAKERPPVKYGGKNRLLTIAFDRELTDRLFEMSRKKRTPLNSLLAASMLLSVNRTLYKGASIPMQTISFSDLRPYLSPPVSEEHLGSYISMLRYTVPVSGRREIWSLAQTLQDRIDQSFRRGDKFIAPLLAVGMMKAIIRSRSMRMAATALSFSGVASIDSVFGEMQVLGLHGFVSNIDLGPQFTAQVHGFDDQLVWDIVYLDSDMDQPIAMSIVDEIQNILRAATE